MGRMKKKYRVAFGLSYWTMAEDEEEAEEICRELLKEDLAERHREGIDSIFGTTIEEEIEDDKQRK